jgi:hypothetical protein
MKINATVQAQLRHVEGLSGEFFLPISILKRILIFQRKNLLTQNETTPERLKSISNTALKTIHFTQLHFLSSKQIAKELKLFKLCPQCKLPEFEAITIYRPPNMC